MAGDYFILHVSLMVMSSKMMKTKRVVLPLENKLAVLDRLKQEHPMQSLLKSMGLGERLLVTSRKMKRKI